MKTNNSTQLSTETRSTQLSLRIFKNEYTANQLRYIHTHFHVLEHSDSVLTIGGSADDLDKVMSLMYSSDDKFKSVFPDFLTEDERKENNISLLKSLDSHLKDVLIEMGINGRVLDDVYEIVESFSKITSSVLRSNNYKAR